ncbi:hypothetical protein BDV95DRAFT_157794 [Massariosphaeria phaeospora]|uniref:BTB domain-containing protein n=1 Tax=Massariosphaeria phaeospora TaxID=100035 RepID=A0A7C8M2H7_9PLEO|nr:hypothetical protein BDV95DRAFT_157794 [Massariosphaeria phaeospora]
MESPNAELMSALASLFESGKYSDLTIVCGAKSYSVHRALICSRSEFFEGACRNPFRESETGVIDLTEDDPEAVEHMVSYLYHLDYLRNSISRRSSRRSSQLSSPLSRRFSTQQKPKKFNLAMVEDPLLATAYAANMSTPMTPPDDQTNQFDTGGTSKLPDSPMADQFMEDPFESVNIETSVDVEKPYLVTHAKVYAIAEKYGISGLKSLARKKFAHQLELHLDSAEFPEACQEAYETTIDTDRGLRDILIQTFRAHRDLTLRKDVELAVRDTPGLAFELFRMASGLPVTSL